MKKKLLVLIVGGCIALSGCTSETIEESVSVVNENMDTNIEVQVSDEDIDKIKNKIAEGLRAAADGLENTMEDLESAVEEEDE